MTSIEPTPAMNHSDTSQDGHRPVPYDAATQLRTSPPNIAVSPVAMRTYLEQACPRREND
jgi:hypothetical protein